MDDETLMPFVDALSASLIIMILVVISFILQTTLSLEASAKGFVAIAMNSKNYTPIEFNRPLRIDIDKKEVLYLINFTLNKEEILKIKSSMIKESEVIIIIHTNQSVEKATVNLVRFYKMIKLPPEINIKSKIIHSESVVDRLTWSD
jgi:hypothetical protein